MKATEKLKELLSEIETQQGALDRVPRTPRFLALVHKVAFEIAGAGIKLFPDNKDIYQGIKQYLEANPLA